MRLQIVKDQAVEAEENWLMLQETISPTKNCSKTEKTVWNCRKE